MSEDFIFLLDKAPTFKDERGEIKVLYESNAMVLKRSFSKKGVFRGMHRQKDPVGQIKLVRVIKGEIIDFILDNSKSGKIIQKVIRPIDDWIKIDKNFFHGFYAVEDTEFEYICDGKYSQDHEESVSIETYLRNSLHIDTLIMSEKDKSARKL